MADRRPTKFARCLSSPVLVHYTLFSSRGLLPLGGILPGANYTLRPGLAFSYIGSIVARHSTSGSQPNFAAWYKEWNYGTFGEGATYIRFGGHHVGHRPTFWFLLNVNECRLYTWNVGLNECYIHQVQENLEVEFIGN